MVVNEVLEKRRMQLIKRILNARIYLLVSIVLTFTNLLGVITGFTWISLPYSLTSVQFTFEYGLYMYSANGGVRPGMLIVFGGLSLVLFVMFAACFFKMKEKRKWVILCNLLFWIDLLVTFVLMALNGSSSFFQLFLYLVDIALHIFVLIQIGRARKAHYALTVLPENEIEGDPYKEFGSNEFDAEDE